jgi:hypothetical protein
VNKQEALEAFEDAAYRSGGLYRERIMASAKLAITIDPDSWPTVLASLRKWRPEFFSQTEAIRREMKSQNYQRQFVSTAPPVLRHTRSSKHE